MALRHIEAVSQHRRQRLRYDEIAVELWLDGYDIALERIAQGTAREAGRFVRGFETLLHAAEFGPLGREGYRASTIARVAARFARTAHRRHPSLTGADWKAAKGTWSSFLRVVAPRAQGPQGIAGGREFPQALGLPVEFAAFFEDPQQGPLLAGFLRGLFDSKVLENLIDGAPKEALRRARQLIRGLESVTNLIRDVPEALNEVPAEWGTLFRLLASILPSLSRAIWLALAVVAVTRAEVTEGLLTSFAVIESVQQQLEETRAALAHRLAQAVAAATGTRQPGDRAASEGRYA
jgi:hypothetical protein